MSSSHNQLTQERKKDKNKKFTFVTMPSSSVSSGSGGFCSATQCSASASTPPAYFAKSSFDGLSRTESLQYYNKSNVDFEDIPISNDITEVSYSWLALTGYVGSMAVTLTTDLLSDFLDHNLKSQARYVSIIQSEAKYWIPQVPRAAFMYYMNASLGKIIAAPVANYMLVKGFGVKKEKAALATAICSVVADGLTSPWGLLFTGIASGLSGDMTAKYIRSNLLSNSFFRSQIVTLKTKINWQKYSEDIFNQTNDEKPYVLISVKMQGCKPCEKMENSYSDAQVSDLVSNNYIPLKIDLSKDSELAESLGVDSAPTTVIVDHNRRIIKTIKGVHKSEVLLSVLKEVKDEKNKKDNRLTVS